MMARYALIAGFALLAAVADQADSLDDCFREDRPAGVGRRTKPLARYGNSDRASVSE